MCLTFTTEIEACGLTVCSILAAASEKAGYDMPKFESAPSSP